MTHATCTSCGAGFVVAFAPGTEFTCGGCGATVVVPSAAAPPPPPAPVAAAQPPPLSAPVAAQPVPPRARPAAAPRPPRPAAPPLAATPPPDPEKARKQKLLVLGLVGLTVVVVAVLGVLIFLQKGSSASDIPARTPGPATSPDATPSTQPASEPARPVVSDTPRRPRPSDPLGAARWDAEQTDASALTHLAFADMAYDRADQLEGEGKLFDAAALRTESVASYEAVLRREPSQARARDRLGFVQYDPAEAKRLAELPYVPRRLKGCIVEVIESIEQRTAGKKVSWPAWLSVKGGAFEDVAVEWRKAFRDAKEYEALEQAKVTDPFYKRADAMAAAIEGDVGPLLKRKKLEGPTFDVHPRKPYVILVHRDTDFETQPIADYWVEVLYQLRDTFLSRFRKLNLKPMDDPTAVLVLRYDTDYRRYVTRGEFTPIFSLAHFEPFSKRLVTWKDPDRTDHPKAQGPSEESLRTVVFHEGTHQLVDYYTDFSKSKEFGQDQALWFSEGIADYFGGHGRTWDDNAGRWRYEPGLINEERVQQVHQAKTSGILFELDKLLDYRRRDYQRDVGNMAKTGTAYAQGWALVYLLSNWDDNKHREKFDEYVKRELAGDSGSKTFEEVFGPGSIDTIEKELLDMIETLAKAAKDRKIINGRLQK